MADPVAADFLTDPMIVTAIAQLRVLWCHRHVDTRLQTLVALLEHWAGPRIASAASWRLPKEETRTVVALARVRARHSGASPP